MQVSNNRGMVTEDENLISQMLHRYLPYWPLFLTLGVVFLISAWLYLRYTTPLYEVNASFIVKDEKKGVDDQNLMEQLDLFGSKKLVENEIEVVKSKLLMRKVVKDLYLYAPFTYVGKIKKSTAYEYSPVILELANPDSLIERKKIPFTFDKTKQEVVIGNSHFPLNQWVSDTLGMLKFMPNPNYVAPPVEKPLYFSLVNVKTITEGILKGLTVAQATKLSSVIQLSMRDPVPKRGEAILNTLISEYENAAIDDKNSLAGNTLKFINKRLGIVITELDSLERGIKNYKTQQGIIDISAQGQLYLDNVGANDAKLSEINVQLAVMDQVEQYVMSKSGQSGIVPSTLGVDDPVLGGLLQQLYTLEVQYEGLRKTTAENNPVLVSISNEIEKIKPSILENIRNQRKNLQAGKANLSGTEDQYSSMLKTLPEKERGLIEKSREQVIENGIYAFLLQKREETALSYGSQISDTRLVDDAQSSVAPVSPKKMMYYLVAIVAAIAAGAGLVALREVFNQSILFRQEIEQFTAIPIIGEIMQSSTTTPFVVTEGARDYVAEQFRQLRTTLAYIGINNKKKRILITSSIGGEGKSHVATNLALSLALTNKKVVLLELDLRKPKLSKKFGLSQDIGLTNYLISNADPEDIIKQTDVNPNLFLISSGAIPPNPSELLINGRLEELLRYLDNVFDYIIMDTAPVGPVTDAYILSGFSDATLYVIRHGITPKLHIKRLENNLKIHPLKNIALIFNGVKNRGMGRYGYGYGYGYGNGYGYGYSENGHENGKKKKTEKNAKATSRQK